MSNPDSDDRWPDYLPVSTDDLVALGAISLNYNYLENIYRIAFSYATGLNKNQMRAIFERLNATSRRDVLRDMMKASNIDKGLEDLVTHFDHGFTICAANRHSIMHAHFGGKHSSVESEGIVLSKFSKSGAASLLFSDTKVLRNVADEIDKQSWFGTDVILALSAFQLCQRQNRVSDFQKTPLPDKLPLPETLKWGADRGPSPYPDPHGTDF